jgi:hypothetical protein
LTSEPRGIASGNSEGCFQKNFSFFTDQTRIARLLKLLLDGFRLSPASPLAHLQKTPVCRTIPSRNGAHLQRWSASHRASLAVVGCARPRGGGASGRRRLGKEKLRHAPVGAPSSPSGLPARSARGRRRRHTRRGVDETAPPPRFAADDREQHQQPAWMSPPRRAVAAPSCLKLGGGRGRWRVEAEQGSRRRRPGSGAASKGLRRRPGSRRPGSGPSSSSLSRAALSSHSLRVLHQRLLRAPLTVAACSSSPPRSCSRRREVRQGRGDGGRRGRGGSGRRVGRSGRRRDGERGRRRWTSAPGGGRSASGGGLAEQAEEEDGGDPRTVGMGKAAGSPRMRHGGGFRAKCSSCCGSCWRCNSNFLFLVMKMRTGTQHRLEESVLGHVQPLDGESSVEPRTAHTDRCTDNSYNP